MYVVPASDPGFSGETKFGHVDRCHTTLINDVVLIVRGIPSTCCHNAHINQAASL